MSETIPVTGRCHCGAIEFEARANPERVLICHCADCQAFAGAPYRTNVMAEDGSFALRKGTPKVYIKTAESGRQREQGFCGECGSALYATSAGEGPKVYALRAGVLAERASLVPTAQIWRDSALPWVDSIGDLPAIPKQP